jgi:hypothetical protein
VGCPHREFPRGNGLSPMSPSNFIRTEVSLYAGVCVGVSVWLLVNRLMGFSTEFIGM